MELTIDTTVRSHQRIGRMIEELTRQVSRVSDRVARSYIVATRNARNDLERVEEKLDQIVRSLAAHPSEET